jgi:RNA polymerase sigma-70 factor (ECF subfamily)
VSTPDHTAVPAPTRDDWYQKAIDLFGPALDRLARAYEADPDKRRDLVQDIHFAVWRSLESYEGRCALRTWVYRVAHNTATSHITRAVRLGRRHFVTLDELAAEPASRERPVDEILARQRALDRLYELIQRLDPIDRQVIVSYLDGIEAAEIAEIVGASSATVGMKIHRIKRLLARQFSQGGTHDR